MLFMHLFMLGHLGAASYFEQSVWPARPIAVFPFPQKKDHLSLGESGLHDQPVLWAGLCMVFPQLSAGYGAAP
jgi:hypothetical protein